MEQTNTNRTDIRFDNVSYREVNRCSEERTYTVGHEGLTVYTASAASPSAVAVIPFALDVDDEGEAT